jgi:hypothetical protein
MPKSNLNIAKALSSSSKLKNELDSFYDENKITLEKLTEEEIKDLMKHIKSDEGIDMTNFKNLINKMK